MKPIAAIIVAFLALITALSSFFIIDQREQALVLLFGEVRRVETEPGLRFKIPFFEQVRFFDKRIIHLDADPEEVIASDQKRVIVDAFVKYSITNPLKFYQTVRSEVFMQDRLKSILKSRLRAVLGSNPLSALLTPERAKIMETIHSRLN
ncbi:MAG: protease modulator HflC, partial [Rickettsiales bacterium]|nr:protease modulator HflC [Rickettsiales bacterium]